MNNTLTLPAQEQVTQPNTGRGELEDLRRTADFAETMVFEMQDHHAFVTMLREKGIPYDDTKPEYWAAMREFSKAYCRANIENDLIADRQAKVINLVASSADFITKQLKKHKERADVATLSEFNELIRGVAQDYIGAPIIEVIRLVVEGAEKMYGHLSEEMKKLAIATVRGVQHEIGFEQLLTAAGLKFQRAGTDDDLKGIDYRVEVDGRVVPIDVKASLSEVAVLKGGYDDPRPYVMRHNTVVTYSMLTGEDFAGRSFTVKPEVLQERSVEVRQFLESAR
jgi:hypothetical protein